MWYIIIINSFNTIDVYKKKPRYLFIFEFLGQFTMRCIIIFENDVDNFEIEHKASKFLGRGA